MIFYADEMGIETSLTSHHSWVQKNDRFVAKGQTHPKRMNILGLISEFGLESKFVSDHSIITLN